MKKTNCPDCKAYLTKVFTDGFPNPHVVKVSQG